MTIEELKEHLKSHHLFVLRRELTHRGNPKKVSFAVVTGQRIVLVDATVQFLLQSDGASLSPYNGIKVVHLFNRWVQTSDQWVNLLSERLYGAKDRIHSVEI